MILTAKKRKWVGRRKVAIKGTPLAYNAAQQSRYTKALMVLVNQMTEETAKQITKLFKSELATEYFEQKAMDASLASRARILMNALTSKFTSLFSERAKPLAETMAAGAVASSASALHTSLKELSGGMSIKTSIVPAGMEDVVSGIISENVSLIGNIPEQYMTNLGGSVYRAIATGRGLADITPAIQKATGVVSRRTRNIALDQTRKAFSAVNVERMKAVGVKQFEWLHSGGSQHPRKSHMAISGDTFSLDPTTLIEQQAAKGVPPEDRGYPGTPINCKCRAVPIVTFEGE